MEGKNKVFETMTNETVGPFHVRVWRDCGAEFRMGPDIEIKGKLQKIHKEWVQTGEPAVKDLPKLIKNEVGTLMDVNAIEILDADHQGGLYYPDWP